MSIFNNTRSNFIKVKCNGCGGQQVVFDRAASTVKCLICDSVLVEPKGGKAKINAEIIEVLE